MSAFDELIASAASRLERENLTSFIASFSNELAQAGEVSRKDKEFVKEFKQVHAALIRVEKKTRQLDESPDNVGADDVNDAKERLYELFCSLDRLQTSALRNPALQPFATRVAQRAREESRKLLAIAQEGLDGELDRLYEQFKGLNQ